MFSSYPLELPIGKEISESCPTGGMSMNIILKEIVPKLDPVNMGFKSGNSCGPY